MTGDPIPIPKNRVSYGEPVKIYDFSKGLWTVKPSELLPAGATPDARNVWYDEESALSKMPGTELLMAEANNAFATNPIYQLFDYRPVTGEHILIIQAMLSTAMKVWSYERQTAYPAGTVTDITPSSGLSPARRCYYANYKNKVYMANGADNLKSWDNNTTLTWEEHHGDEAEHFKYLCVWDGRLIAAHSTANPKQLIYSEQDGDDFDDYYGDNGHWKKFPEIGHITGICVSSYGSLLVFARDGIVEIQGSFTMDGDMKHVISRNTGTVAHNTIQAWGDNVVFAAVDGLYALSRSRIAVSTEDENLRTEDSMKPLSGEIQNFWDNYVTLPEPGEYKHMLWSGYASFTQTIAFDTGTSEIEAYDEIFIGTDRCLVVYVDLASGTWAGGDGVGTLYVTRMIPHNATIADNENILVGATQSAIVAGSTALAGSIEEARGIKCNIAPLSSSPDVINFAPLYRERDQTDDVPCIVRDRITAIEETTQDAWVDLRSLGGKNAFFGESFEPKAIWGAPPGVFLYLKENGDISGDTFKLYLTASKSVEGVWEPDFTRIYAEGSTSGTYLHGLKQLTFDAGEIEIKPGDTIKNAAAGETASGTVVMVVCTDIATANKYWSGDQAEGEIYLSSQTGTWVNDDDIYVSTTKCAVVNGGDSAPISTGCYAYVPFEYWDYPISTEYCGTDRYTHLVVKVTGDDSTNYIQWGYNSAGALANSIMHNSDSDTPASQEDCDYTFKFPEMHYEYMPARCYFVTDPVQADSDLANWASVEVELDEKIIGGERKRYSEVDTVYYKVRAADSNWSSSSWTETTNGGPVSGTSRWIKLKVVLSNPQGGSSAYSDSITIKSIRAIYETQAKVNQLTASVVKDRRYWFSTKVTDWSQQPS